jgi:hypothetical protein
MCFVCLAFGRMGVCAAHEEEKSKVWWPYVCCAASSHCMKLFHPPSHTAGGSQVALFHMCAMQTMQATPAAERESFFTSSWHNYLTAALAARSLTLLWKCSPCSAGGWDRYMCGVFSDPGRKISLSGSRMCFRVFVPLAPDAVHFLLRPAASK